jgi:hypothetical protein
LRNRVLRRLGYLPLVRKLEFGHVQREQSNKGSIH